MKAACWPRVVDWQQAFVQEIFEMHTLPLHVSRHKFGWEHFYAKNYKLLKGEALVLQDHTKDAKASKNVLKSVCIWSFQSGNTSIPGMWFPHLRLLIICWVPFVCFFTDISLNQLENTLTVSTTLAPGYMSASSLLINRYEKAESNRSSKKKHSHLAHACHISLFLGSWNMIV